ncbi:MAG: hypothetical protein WBF06_06950 [Candidatus Acidiferrales bacterium]
MSVQHNRARAIRSSASRANQIIPLAKSPAVYVAEAFRPPAFASAFSAAASFPNRTFARANRNRTVPKFAAWALLTLCALFALAAIPARAQSAHEVAAASPTPTPLVPIALFPAQGTVGFGEAYSFVAHESDPSHCSEGSVEFNLSSATPKYCSAPNTWTSFGSGGGGGSGTVNSGTQFAFGEYSSSGTAISSGPTPPSTNGEYFCGYNVTASAAVAPSCWLNSLAPRAVTGTTATDTILSNDAIVEYQGSVAVATSLPAPATLGNTGFYVKLINNTSGSATAITVSAAGSYTFSSTGSATLTVAQGQSCSLLVDPAGSVWDDTCGDLPFTAGTNISITRGQFGPTISASGSGGGVSSFTGDGTLLNNSASTGAVTATLAQAGAHKYFGNNTGSAAAPSYESLVSADIPNNAANTTGNAATATALASTPSQCSGSQFSTGIAASGNANCSSIPTLNQNTTGNAATATALASTPTQCSGSQFATGIAASGNANCATPSGGSGSFSAATATVFDDFLMNSSSTSAIGFVKNGGGGSVSPQPTGSNQQAANHPGLIELESGGASGGTDWEYWVLSGQSTPLMNPTANSFTITGDLLPSGTTVAAPNGTTRFGVFDTTSTNQEAPNSAVYFEAVNTGVSGAANWNCVVNTSGTPNSTSSGVTAATGTFYALSITFTSSTSVSFAINGTTVCSSLSATVPSALMSPAFETTDNANGAANMLIDYFAITWNLTR